jgi:hypothetical protein
VRISEPLLACDIADLFLCVLRLRSLANHLTRLCLRSGRDRHVSRPLPDGNHQYPCSLTLHGGLDSIYASTLALKKWPNYRGYIGAIWMIPNILGGILVITLPWSNKAGILVSLYITGVGTREYAREGAAVATAISNADLDFGMAE